jgi:phosphate-selective porin OprO/OprP
VQTGRIGEEDTFWGLEAAALWGPFSVQGEYAQLDVDLPSGAFISTNPPGTGLLASSPNPFIGVPDPGNFDGWYVEAGWFFGGHKTYSHEGKWDRPVVDNPMFHGSGGWGALQVFGKYDVLDMGGAAGLPVSSSFSGACANTRLYPGQVPNSAGDQQNPNRIPLCGEMETWTVGLNWWPTPYTRVVVQYSESDLSGYPNLANLGVPFDPSLPPGKASSFDGGVMRGAGARVQFDW